MGFNSGGATQKAVLLGSIRTTGEHAPVDYPYTSAPYTNDDYYRTAMAGASILTVGGNCGYSGRYRRTGSRRADPNPTLKRWHDLMFANYSLNASGAATANYPSTEGIATMAGGNIDIQSGGNFNAQAGTFGAGNLTIYAGVRTWRDASS